MCFEFVNSIVVNDTKKITNLKIKKVNNNIIYFEEDNRIGLMDINGNILVKAFLVNTKKHIITRTKRQNHYLRCSFISSSPSAPAK